MLLAQYPAQFESGFWVFQYLALRGILAGGAPAAPEEAAPC